MENSNLKPIPELRVMRSTPHSKRIGSQPLLHLPRQKSSVTLKELRTVPRRGKNNAQNAYIPPISGREWWRVTLKETPVPGSYDIRDFLQDKELNKIKPTYNFKAEGRDKKPGIIASGELLLPGAYEHLDFLEELNKLNLSYQFKSDGRKRELPGIRDRDCIVAPCAYKTSSDPVKKLSVWHGNFKSQSPRFPTKYFNPKEGPPPGSYNPTYVINSKIISSSFKSRIPRFSTSQTKVPGPAHYASTRQSPQPPSLMKMGRMHGLFFRNSFEV